MPAAAVIPAPLAYTLIVAVKRLVVGLDANTLTLIETYTVSLKGLKVCS